MNDRESVPVINICFKGSRIESFCNPMEFPIQQDDPMVVEADRGEDLGFARVNHKSEQKESEESLPVVLRKASQQDLIRFSENCSKEKIAFQFCERKIHEISLDMKLVDVEYRLDRKKIIFYFTSDERIDFRELVKILAAEYKTRIEMRQISTREELKKTGGIGVCGEPLCCQNWLNSFEPISTHLVKNQNLPMNPSKISGVCGKLKCCLRYEFENYSEMLNKFPPYGTRLNYNSKKCVLEKIDIFQKTATMKFEDDQIEEISFDDFKNKVKSNS